MTRKENSKNWGVPIGEDREQVLNFTQNNFRIESINEQIYTWQTHSRGIPCQLTLISFLEDSKMSFSYIA